MRKQDGVHIAPLLFDLTTSVLLFAYAAPLYARPPLSPRHHAAATADTGSSSKTNSSSSTTTAPAGPHSCSSLQKQQQQTQQPHRPATQQSPRPAGDGSSSVGDNAAGCADVDRNALFSKYKHTTAQGMQQSEVVRQQQQLVVQLKQELKVNIGF